MRGARTGLEPPRPDGRARQASLVRDGQIAFNRGEFFAAHELWEVVWLELHGAERTAVQGLIQIAAGFHHLREGRPGPAARLLDKGARKLPSPGGAAAMPLLAALRIDALFADVERLLAAWRERPGVPGDAAGIAL